MNYSILYASIAVGVVSLVSLIGIVMIVFTSQAISKIIALLVSLAAGTLLGDVFFHIFPEIDQSYGFNNTISVSIVVGIFFFFFLEHVLDWRHCHSESEKRHVHPVAVNNTIADGIHNLIDGVIIGASFEISTSLGIATAIAVILHEIPQEIGDFGVLVSTGLSNKKALILNLLTALIAYIGLFLVTFLGNVVENVLYIFLAFSAGGFIYISMADLMPSIKHEMNFKKRFLQLFIVFIGILLMFVFSIFE